MARIAEIERILAERPVAYLPRAGCYVNLVGDYDYLTDGYYTSQALEDAGATVYPTCKEAVDSYVVPVFLERAKTANLPVSEFYLTNAHFEPPVIVDAVNPFMYRHSVVRRAGHQERVAKSLTRNYKYAICCQELPPGSSVGFFRAVLGWCQPKRYRPLAVEVLETLHIPLARLRVITLPDGTALLSDLGPLPFASLNARERAHLNRVVQWPT